MRSKFDEQLELLNRELITMGALCENAIAMSAKAVTKGDLSLTAPIFRLRSRLTRRNGKLKRCA